MKHQLSHQLTRRSQNKPLISNFGPSCISKCEAIIWRFGDNHCLQSPDCPRKRRGLLVSAAEQAIRCNVMQTDVSRFHVIKPCQGRTREKLPVKSCEAEYMTSRRPFRQTTWIIPFLCEKTEACIVIAAFDRLRLSLNIYHKTFRY